MKKYLIILILLSVCKVYSQNFTVSIAETSATHMVPHEFVFDIHYKNTSSDTLAFYFIRTVNNVPSGWESSFCFDACFPPFMDSIATTEDFSSTPLAPNEERVCQLHIISDTTVGLANVSIKVGVLNSSETRTINLMAQGVITSVSDNIIADKFNLYQNYPNPFNPSTKISFSLKKSSHTKLDVVDVNGSLVNIIYEGYLSSGEYSFNFNSAGLSSGIYFYRLTSSGKTITKKMLLEK